ncbi:putative membrane protein YccC [Pseudoduganella flava]|uniref:FUSC family protein n=1 Tax=Pseudoduganella flava TaxID=871742 RepID=A0A562Q4S7_9BURK|nr:FUSC family protein [Pseudoduganella flava]QGZ41740.1 FUSC family protein [Pseudoduganella flava]TWI51743.1 putative membrane protein YccC [Pseudoduganella flava]
MTPDSAAPPTSRLSHLTGATRRALQGWVAADGERLLFVVRMLAAAYGALWLALRLGLDAPLTAVATTFVLALPSSGMVLEKALYRLLGTVVGCTAALTLVALFPQQAPPLFAGLALWIALCTAGAAMHRNQQSYSFVLAGYTACMIAVPALDNPANVFALAVTRATEVGLGVLVAITVHDVLLPRAHGPQVLRTVQARYERFLGFCRQVLEHRLPPAEAELNHLRFAADIAALESGRAAAFFEAGLGRAQTRQLHAFNEAFMAALTTFYTLHRLLHRMRTGAASPVPALVAPLEALLAQALGGALAQSGSIAGAPIDMLPAALAQQAESARTQLPPGDERLRIDFDTAVELAERFARHLVTFVGIYHGLAQKKRMQVSEPQAYAPKTPPGIVAASGARAAIALLCGATLWYWLAWPQLSNALLMSTIFCALASGSPRPTAMIKQVLTGFVIGAPLTYATVFLLLARADGFPMLMLATAPLLCLAGWLTSDPKRAGIGIGMAMLSSQFLAPQHLVNYDAGVVMNSLFAQTGGVVLAYLIFTVVLPEHTMGNRTHVAAALWREALSACTARLRGQGARLRHRFDNRVRDLLSQLNAAAGPAPSPEARAVVRQGLTLLELGHAVIELRALARATGADAALDPALRAVADYLRVPGEPSCRAAVAALQAAGPAVRTALADDPSSLRAALTALHSIHTSLQDQLPPPTYPLTGVIHAS